MDVIKDLQQPNTFLSDLQKVVQGKIGAKLSCTVLSYLAFSSGHGHSNVKKITIRKAKPDLLIIHEHLVNEVISIKSTVSIKNKRINPCQEIINLYIGREDLTNNCFFFKTSPNRDVYFRFIEETHRNPYFDSRTLHTEGNRQFIINALGQLLFSNPYHDLRLLTNYKQNLKTLMRYYDVVFEDKKLTLEEIFNIRNIPSDSVRFNIQAHLKFKPKSI